jgi:hypothetical protein
VFGQRVVARGYLRDRRGRGTPRLTLTLPMNLLGDARGQRRSAFYRRATRPGAMISRANLYLTIQNRRGGPQTDDDWTPAPAPGSIGSPRAPRAGSIEEGT